MSDAPHPAAAGAHAAATRERAQALDAADPLAGFREHFERAGEGLYLDGNSLGRLPLATRERVVAVLDQWGSELVSGWHEWIDLPLRAGDAIGALIGAAPGEVIATDSVTVNLYKLVCAALDARGPGTLVTDRGNFPTDRYVLEGIAGARGLGLRIFDSDDLDGPLPGDLAGLDRGDVVVLSHVAYRSGALADMAALTAAARERGATLIWDLSHSAGALEVDLAGAGAELAVGCTYKYLNAGPGSPGYLYVASALQGALRSPVQGWFGQSEQFAMERDYDPVPGIARFLAGTPPILQLAAVEEGARLTAEAGLGALGEKSTGLTELIVALHDEWLAPLGFELGSPREAARRGSHVSLRHPRAWTFTRALIDAGVTPDFRGPDSIRLGVAPLYTRYTDVWDALDRLRAIAARTDLPDAPPARVT
jgi:kynureninase